MTPSQPGDGNAVPPETETPERLRTTLVAALRASDALHDAAVERALLTVPRHLFLPDRTLREAYADVAVPTHWDGETAISSASQPAIVSLMLEQLRLEPGQRVLEIGAGTGYNAALLAELVGPAGAVVSVELGAQIAGEAHAHLAAAGYERVRVVVADGGAGWPDAAPYDRVIVTAGAEDIAPAWFEQLTENGLLVLPLWLNGAEASVALRKRGGMLHSESLVPCGFMRLRGAESGATQWALLPDGRRLMAQRAAELTQPVAALLRTRPRRRFWLPADAGALQRLGLAGYDVVAIYPPTRAVSRRRTLGHRGLYAVGEDGPSLALLSRRLPLLLVFGGTAAERVLDEAARAVNPPAGGPLTRWHITVRPREALTGPPEEGVVRLLRRHCAFDILPAGNAAP
jgi:protein-L-isoaspartate(D-aspartate) O-methyltransferase